MILLKKSLPLFIAAFLLQAGIVSQSYVSAQQKVNVKAEYSFVKLDSFLTAAVENKWVAGSTAIIMQNGGIVYDKAFGMKDIEAGQVMQTSDIFRIASMSKAIVTAAAMTLVEQGKLSLNDPLSKYIPGFKNAKVLKTFNSKDTTYTTEPANTQITIRNLITHTSGIAYGFSDPRMSAIYSKNGIPDLATTKNITIEETVNKLADLPLGVQPNTKFYYGLSTDVLGRVIEIASGEPLDKFVTKSILQPCGMKDTYFFLPDDKANRLTAMYSEKNESNLVRLRNNAQGNVNFPIEGAKTYFSGGSGLSSTTLDYAKFLQMILDFGKVNGKEILKPETISQMTSNQIDDIDQGPGYKFGLGLQIAMKDFPEKGIKAGKLSWGGAFNTTYWIDPHRKSVVVLMTQVYPAKSKGKLYTSFETLVNKALDGI